MKSLFKKYLLTNNSTKQTLFKNTIWLFFSDGVLKVTMFVISILIARKLSVENYGIFSFALSFVLLFSVVADFGFNVLTIREIARKKSAAEKFISNILTLKIFTSLLTFTLIFVVLQFLNKNVETKVLVYILGGWLILRSVVQFFESVFRSFEKMQFEVISKFVYAITLFMSVYLILLMKLNILMLTLAYAGSILIAFFIAYILIQNKFSNIYLALDFKFSKNLIKKAIPFALSGTAVSIYFWIGTVMLSTFKSNEEVGWYNAAYNLVFSLAIIPTYLMISLYPKLSRAFINSKSLFVKGYFTSIKYILVISIIIFPILFILASRIVLFLYTQNYYPSIAIFRILLVAELFAYFSIIFLFTLNAMNKQSIYTRVVILSLVINIILNIVLIPKYSYYGVSVSTVITEFIGFLILLFYTGNRIVHLKNNINS